MSPLLLLIQNKNSQIKLLTAHFESLNYQVTTTTTAQQTLEWLIQAFNRDHLPNIIVLDLLLDETDIESGLNICRQLKSNPKFRAIPLLVFTENYQMQYMNQSYAAGADYYVNCDNGLKNLELRIQTILIRRMQSTEIRKD